MLILLNKLQQISLLLSGNRFSGNRIINNDGCQLKFKWILRSRSSSTAIWNAGLRTPRIEWMELYPRPSICWSLINHAFASDKRTLSIRRFPKLSFSAYWWPFYIRQPYCDELLFSMKHTFLPVPNSIVATVGYDTVKQIRFNLFFFLTQGRLPLLPFWHWVILVQTPTVYIFSFPSSSI